MLFQTNKSFFPWKAKADIKKHVYAALFCTLKMNGYSHSKISTKKLNEVVHYTKIFCSHMLVSCVKQTEI